MYPHRRLLLALALGCVVTACSVLTSLNGLEGDRPGADASTDVSTGGDSSDVSTSDVPILPGDAAPDVTDAADTDAGDGGPCSGPLLVGANDPSIPGTDIIAVGSIDAYGYTVGTAGTARCAWIHLEAAGGGLQIGVYSQGDAGPNQLKAAGTIPSPKAGWNTVVLDQAVTVAKGDVLWIGLLCAASPPPTIRAVGACPNGNLKMWSRLASSLPLQFSGTGPNAECSAPFYLTP